MKVLLVNGSPHQHGCTYTALCEIADTLKIEGIESEHFWIGSNIGGKSETALRDCLIKRYSRDQYILTNKLSTNFFEKRGTDTSII